jgi:hypothetical protein
LKWSNQSIDFGEFNSTITSKRLNWAIVNPGSARVAKDFSRVALLLNRN